MLKKIHDLLEKLNIPNWLAILLFVCLLLRIPSFFEPFYYGDEMIYLTLGQGLRQGVALYSGLHDNKPPVLYLIAALAGSLVWFKVFLAIASLISIVLFAKIAGKIFEGKLKTQKVATLLFALLTTLPLLEGNTANAENFMMAFSLGAIYILLSKKLNIKNLLFSGFLFGVSFLTKVPAIFDLPIIILFWIITTGLKKDNLIKIIKNSFYITVGFLIPVVLSFIWYGVGGHLGDYVKAAFMQNVGYVSSWRPGDVQKSFLAKNAPLLIRFLVASLGIIITFFFRRRLSKPFVLASVWLMLSLFAVTLSERPYPHYLLQSVGPIAILLGILFTRQTVEQSLVVIPLFFALFVPVYYKFWYYPTSSYYLRFMKYVVGVTNKEKYLSGFNKYTPRNYQIADFLLSSSYKKDRVFVWGPDSPIIYALSRRISPIKFVADYHVFDYSSKNEVVKMLSVSKPRFIVITSEAKPFLEITGLLRQNYLLVNKIDDAEIWSLTN
ncbi:MAG: hypothetical protein NTV24_02090 [Candidatus Woesebacteria bacterium]|nr:hypothetical protein [Candidatus Woesebacteria bacterium]